MPLKHEAKRHAAIVVVAGCLVTGYLVMSIAARAAVGDFDGPWNATIACDRPFFTFGEPYSFSFRVDVQSGKLSGRFAQRDQQGYEETFEWQGSLTGDRVKVTGEAKRAIIGSRWSYDLTGKLVPGGPMTLEGGEYAWFGSNYRKPRDCRLTLAAIIAAPARTAPDTAAGGRARERANAGNPAPVGPPARSSGGVVVPFPDERPRATPVPQQAPPPRAASSRPAARPANPSATELDRAATDLERALAARRGTAAPGPGPTP